MKKMWAILAGISLAIVIVVLADIISHQIYPLPENLDFTNIEQVAAYMKIIPAGALFCVILGQVLALFVGGVVVIKMAKEVKSLHIFCLIFILLSIMNLLMVPHPTWFAVASLLALVLIYLLLVKTSSKNQSA